MIRHIWMSLVLALMVGVSQAAVDTFEFETEDQRKRFYSLSGELRCPKCQNQNIADSDAPVATDLRRELFRLLDEGESDEEIVEFMVARYGDFVRYKPALTVQTIVLWFGPALFLLIGLVSLAVMLRRRQRAMRDTHAGHLTVDEQHRLRALLEKKNSDD